MIKLLGLPLLLLCGCAASSGRAASPSPSSLSEHQAIATAGPRCRGGLCACRPVDQFGRTVLDSGGEGHNEAPIAVGQKRFELRTGRGLDAMEITVAGRGALVKTTESAEPSCAYIDLPPGKHAVHLRVRAARGEEGMAPSLLVHEYGTETQDWYDTLRFSCGDTEACIEPDLADWASKVGSSRGIQDPCGSVKISGVHYRGEHAPNHRMTEVELDFTLNVYKFAPRFPKGGRCKGPDAPTAE
jgi:hypothetical protein